MLILLLLLCAVTARGQYTSENGLFEVDWIRGCTGAEITINILNPSCDCITCPCNSAPEITSLPVVEDDFTPFSFTHVYATEPGEYYLVILMDDEQDRILLTIEDLPPPTYKVYACSGQAVQVVVDDTTYEQYEVDFGDGTIITIDQGDPVPDHSYASNTPRMISVRGINTGSANNCAVTSTSFVPMSNLTAPEITSVTPLDANNLALEFNTAQFMRYELYMGTNAGSLGLVASYDSQVTGDTIPSLNLNNNYYCFQLISKDPCGGPDNVSNNACSIQLNVDQGNGVARLAWQTRANSSGFSVSRDDQPLAMTGMNTFMYNDSTGSCGTTHCYTVQADFYGASSISLPVCKEFIRTTPPPPIDNLALQVVGRNVQLSWYPTAATEYDHFDIYKTGPTKQQALVTKVAGTTATDEGLNIPGLTDYCYEIVPTDKCGNTNPDNREACVIQVSGSVNLRDEVAVSWNPYNGYSEGLDHYSVELADGNGGFTEIGQTADTTLTFNDSNQQLQELQLRVMAYPSEGGIGTSISNVVLLYKTTNLIYPEAFTPDEDGLNDVFEVKARYIASYELQIFNRWGEMIFSTQDINTSWDGSTNGKPGQSGVYAGKIRITDEAGHEIIRELSIVLVRH